MVNSIRLITEKIIISVKLIVLDSNLLSECIKIPLWIYNIIIRGIRLLLKAVRRQETGLQCALNMSLSF